jgi:hypothetical protein
VIALEAWLAVNPTFEDTSFLLPNQRGAASRVSRESALLLEFTEAF